MEQLKSALSKRDYDSAIKIVEQDSSLVDYAWKKLVAQKHNDSREPWERIMIRLIELGANVFVTGKTGTAVLDLLYLTGDFVDLVRSYDKEGKFSDKLDVIEHWSDWFEEHGSRIWDEGTDFLKKFGWL